MSRNLMNHYNQFLMKWTIFFGCFLIISCNSNQDKGTPTLVDSTSISPNIPLPDPEAGSAPVSKSYENQRFKDVKVERIGVDSFRISGQGQIFEASFNWIVEDGHNELKSGYEMTDAGAPEWGSFNFILQVQKERENSTLTLVLFESSAKDGSRQHELPIPLY